MEVADQLWSTGARGLVGIDQRGGIDLEMAMRLGVQVGGGPGSFDPGLGAEEQTAGFVRVGLRSGLKDFGVGLGRDGGLTSG